MGHHRITRAHKQSAAALCMFYMFKIGRGVSDSLEAQTPRPYSNGLLCSSFADTYNVNCLQ